jgi:hypothetical protein
MKTSVVMTGKTHLELVAGLIRDDGQEDIRIALYRASTGRTRRTAIVQQVVEPMEGDRFVHGNASITGSYVLRVATLAAQQGMGLAICHSHPLGGEWQGMSGPDRDAESSYAVLASELTDMPLIGMTLAGHGNVWSARHWDQLDRRVPEETQCTNVRVVDDHYLVSWNDGLVRRPGATERQLRTVSCWGERVHEDLIRRSVLIVGLGSVGLEVAIHLAATGVVNIGIMDFDIVKEHNLDRLIGATEEDVRSGATKLEIAERLIRANSTAAQLNVQQYDKSICESDAITDALDYDMIFCCVDRPWPRAVLNSIAYTDLIPVIDGGIAVDTFGDLDGMRNATWRSHVLRPGNPCMACTGQLDGGLVALDIQGLLDDPEYIMNASRSTEPSGQNVAVLSISVAASLLAQYVSLNVAPGGFGDPGPLQYWLSTHTLEHIDSQSNPSCPYERSAGIGDGRTPLGGVHRQAEEARRQRLSQGDGHSLRRFVGRLIGVRSRS